MNQAKQLLNVAIIVLLANCATDNTSPEANNDIIKSVENLGKNVLINAVPISKSGMTLSAQYRITEIEYIFTDNEIQTRNIDLFSYDSTGNLVSISEVTVPEMEDRDYQCEFGYSDAQLETMDFYVNDGSYWASDRIDPSNMKAYGIYKYKGEQNKREINLSEIIPIPYITSSHSNADYRLIRQMFFLDNKILLSGYAFKKSTVGEKPKILLGEMSEDSGGTTRFLVSVDGIAYLVEKTLAKENVFQTILYSLDGTIESRTRSRFNEEDLTGLVEIFSANGTLLEEVILKWEEGQSNNILLFL